MENEKEYQEATKSAEKIGGLYDRLRDFYDKAERNEIDENDYEQYREELEEGAREAAEEAEKLDKKLNKIPYIGQLAVIAKDLSILFKRAFLLMLENMKPRQKPKPEPEKIVVSNEGKKESDRIASIQKGYERKPRENHGLERSEKGRNVARTEIDYDQDPYAKTTVKHEAKESNIKKDAAKRQREEQRLDAYNRSVAERARSNQSEMGSEMGSQQEGPSASMQKS
jgi:hypothetical protein